MLNWVRVSNVVDANAAKQAVLDSITGYKNMEILRAVEVK